MIYIFDKYRLSTPHLPYSKLFAALPGIIFRSNNDYLLIIRIRLFTTLTL